MAGFIGSLRGLRGVGLMRPVTSLWGGRVMPRRHLPICTVDTNLSKNQLPEDFSVQFCHQLAEILNKPTKLVTVTVRSDVDVCRDGNTKPSVAVQIWSVGVFDEKRNPVYTEALFKFILSKLEIPDDRLTILFHPIEKTDAGHLLHADTKKG